MKTMFAAGALVAALGLATAASAQSSTKAGRPAKQLPKIQLKKNSFERPDPAPTQVFYPVGHEAPASDLRAVQTLYDCTNTGTVYAYFAAGTTGLGIAPNGALESVQFGPVWQPASPLTQINLCVRRMVTTGSQSFKIFVRIWDNVNQAAANGTDVKSGQLPTGTPQDLFYTAAGGAAFTVTGQYTAGFALALPAGFIPADNNVGIEIRLVAATVTTVADAALPANTSPNMGMDCYSTQSLLGTFPPPAAPSVGSGYPVDANGHIWVDVTDATATPPTAHDGLYFAGDLLNAAPALGEELLDIDGPTWANIYLKVFGDVTAPAPGNDNCENATPVTIPGAAPNTVTVSGQTTVGANAEVVVPPGCGVGNPATQAGVWYSFVGRGYETTVSTCGSGAFDSVVRVYTGTCAAPECLNGLDDAGAVGCPGNFDAATVKFCAANGVPYLIYVRPFDGVSGGAFDLVVTENANTCPVSCSLDAVGANDLTSQNPTCGVPSSPFGTCAAAQPTTDCQVYFDSITRGDDGLGGQIRGVDAFLYTVPAGATNFNIRMRSEFPSIVFVLKSGDDTPGNQCNAFLVGSPGQFNSSPCIESVMNVTGVTAGGVYLIQVAPAGFGPAGAPACGSTGTKYRLTLASDLCVPAGPDCFTKGAVLSAASCSPTYNANAFNRPTNAGHYSMGGANSVLDTNECISDWDGNGCILPSDVAAFVASAFYDFNNSTSDAQITCGAGPSVPATVASFVTRWFNALSNPAGDGCN